MGRKEGRQEGGRDRRKQGGGKKGGREEARKKTGRRKGGREGGKEVQSRVTGRQEKWEIKGRNRRRWDGRMDRGGEERAEEKLWKTETRWGGSN